MPTYLRDHHKPGTSIYQRAIPEPLRLILKERAAITEYIPHAKDSRKAQELARAYATRDDTLFRRLRAMSPVERMSFGVHGSVNELFRVMAKVEAQAEPYQPITADPARIAEMTGHDAGGIALDILEHNRKGEDRQRKASKRLALIKGVAAKVADDSEFSFGGLFNLWKLVKEPKRDKDPLRSLNRFKALPGIPDDYRRVTQDHVIAFRNHNEAEGLSKNYQAQHLDHVRAMFAVAANEGYLDANPAEGVTVRGKTKRVRKASEDRPFNGKQVTALLDKAKREGFGKERHESVLWILKLLAWTGARPQEILQLTRFDVETRDGVPVIWIRQTDSNGRVHPEKSLKNDKSRRPIPLHPAVQGFVKWAHGVTSKPDSFVFDCFPWANKEKGRTGWVVSNFGAFMRKTLGIDGASRLTLYSFRHTFISAMRDASIGRDRQLVLTGHAAGDVHGDEYGRGAKLKLLAKDVARINVLKA